MCVCVVGVHSPMMLKRKLENESLCVYECLRAFWVVEVVFLCFLGREYGNNGHIVWRVGKEEGEVEEEEEEE